jgi:pilus assembly protein CpaF
VHVVRGAGGRRRVSEIAVLTRVGSGLVQASPAVTFSEDGSTRRHPGAEGLERRLRR